MNMCAGVVVVDVCAGDALRAEREPYLGNALPCTTTNIPTPCLYDKAV